MKDLDARKSLPTGDDDRLSNKVRDGTKSKKIDTDPHGFGNQWDQQHHIRRYNLALPKALYAELKREAGRNNTTMLELIKQFIKLGLVGLKLKSTPTSTLMIREEGSEKDIAVLI